jgi:nucleotide-binding universal stress UspA family protein
LIHSKARPGDDRFHHGSLEGRIVMFRNILVPVDGSSHAERAVEVAADLATKYGGKLTLLHVIEMRALPEELQRFAEVEGIGGTRPDAMRGFAERILEGATLSAQRHGAVQPALEIEQGDPARVILETVKARGIDTVIMGSRGVGGLQGLLLGSVSHKVASHAPCTVITVK